MNDTEVGPAPAEVRPWASPDGGDLPSPDQLFGVRKLPTRRPHANPRTRSSHVLRHSLRRRFFYGIGAVNIQGVLCSFKVFPPHAARQSLQVREYRVFASTPKDARLLAYDWLCRSRNSDTLQETGTVRRPIFCGKSQGAGLKCMDGESSALRDYG
jgi:hypothetical protein